MLARMYDVNFQENHRSTSLDLKYVVFDKLQSKMKVRVSKSFQ